MSVASRKGIIAVRGVADTITITAYRLTNIFESRILGVVLAVSARLDPTMSVSRSIHRTVFLAFMATATMVLPTTAKATWYGENVANGSDIMMMDVCWPWWPESTYFANFNFAINPGGVTGYAGYAIGAPTLDPDHRPNFDSNLQSSMRPGSVWSFWGGSKSGEPVRIIANSEYTYPSQYIGEGASGSLGGPVWPFVRNHTWYRMMVRLWQPAGVKDSQIAYMGRWIKDTLTGKWHLYGIAKLPIPAKSFTGNAGFLEDFGNGGRSVRSMYRRLGYCRKDGKWLKSDTVTFDVPPFKGKYDTYWIANVQPEGDHEYLAMELSSNPSLLPQKLTGKPLPLGQKSSFTVKQPDQPTLDRCQVQAVHAETNGHQVHVSWMVPPTSAPQLGYRVEVFNNPSCQGRPIAAREENMPIVQECLIDCVVSHPTVRLTVVDVFDQAAPSVTIAAKSLDQPKPTLTIPTAPGLAYTLYSHDSYRHFNLLYPPNPNSPDSVNENHYWSSLAELAQGKVEQSGHCRGLDTSLRGDRTVGYAFRFGGLLNVPVSGLYLFHVRGSDAYRVQIDNQNALVWDGVHGPTERTFVANLAKGAHPIEIVSMVDHSPAPGIYIEWEGPRMSRQEIPLENLMNPKAGALPSATISTKSLGNGLAKVNVKALPAGHRLSAIQLYLGRLQIAESHSTSLSYQGAVLDGVNRFWTRLVYDGKRTIDSEPVVLRQSNSSITGWNLGVAGESNAIHGLSQTGPNSFSFIGEGEFVLTRPIAGDFTLTCKVDQWAGQNGERVNPSSWVGLVAREDASKNGYAWGQQFGIMQTGGEGLRTTPNYSDLGATRVSDFELPKGRPWLRVVRKGNQWSAWSSVDGVSWQHGVSHFVPTRSKMDAGVIFRALPQDARAYFQASVSHVELQSGVVSETAPPKSTAVQDGVTDGIRFTGVAIAPSNSKTVVLRSSGKGVVRTTDGGEHWKSIDEGRKGAFLYVRSLAIHPMKPDTMIRAYGHLGTSGLSITTDGGLSWQDLNFPGDFDGAGPSVLCCEVVAFDSTHPDTILAGSESKGLYRSEDGGKSWTLIGAAGQRITAVVLNRFGRGDSDQAELHVLTCADRWMTLLGRGSAEIQTEPKISRDYYSRDGGKSIHEVCAREDLGYLNAAFDKGAWPEELPYATTHGLTKALGNGVSTYLFPREKNLEAMRPYTAIGTAALVDHSNGRAIVGPLVPSREGNLSLTDEWAFNWQLPARQPGEKAVGTIAVAGEIKEGNLWWFVRTDGIYRSEDGGKTLLKIVP